MPHWHWHCTYATLNGDEKEARWLTRMLSSSSSEKTIAASKIDDESDKPSNLKTSNWSCGNYIK